MSREFIAKVNKHGSAPLPEKSDDAHNQLANEMALFTPQARVQILDELDSHLAPDASPRKCAEHFALKRKLKAVRLGVEWAIDHRAAYDFLGHPSCLYVTDPDFRAIALICDLVRKAGDRAVIVGLDTVARRVRLREAKQ